MKVVKLALITTLNAQIEIKLLNAIKQSTEKMFHNLVGYFMP